MEELDLRIPNIMNVIYCALWVACCGGLGAFLACCHQQAFQWPKWETVKKKKVLIPGSLGDIFVGVGAAILVWILNGPVAFVDFSTPPPWKVSFTGLQLVSSALVGFSGGKVLTILAQKQAEQITSAGLSKMLKNLLEKQAKE